MALDGLFLHCLRGEINAAADAHIYKIYQPSKEELVISLRKKDFNKKLLVSVKGGMARIHFTENAPENPETPPMFCMLLRKHFQNAKLLRATMQGFERIITLDFSGTNEMGDRVDLKIICELMGNNSNIILIGNDGRIIDAVRRGSIEMGGRITAPGALYLPPERQDKLSIISETDKICERAVSKEGPLSAALVDAADGMSPLVAREIVFVACGDDTDAKNKEHITAVKSTLSSVKDAVASGGTPYILYDKDGTPKDFSFIPIRQYGSLYELRRFESYSDLLDTFYAERERAALQKRAGGDLEKLLKNLISRANRRMNTRKKELSKAADREKLLLFGELIKANIHLIAPGSNSITVNNYYDENGGTVDIPLDPSESGAANASRYFKEYRKSRSAETTLKELIKEDEGEIDYLETVAFSLASSKSLSEIAQIREELAAAGYIKTRPQRQKKQKKKVFDILSLESPDGYKVLVGKNNLQNDYITTVLAGKGDMWFHTKNIPGSHVVVLCGGEPISEETTLFAARTAAKHSAAALSSNVPVDYTPVKYVKKPSKAKAGMVIYTTNKTIYVTPGEKLWK